MHKINLSRLFTKDGTFNIIYYLFIYWGNEGKYLYWNSIISQPI